MKKRGSEKEGKREHFIRENQKDKYKEIREMEKERENTPIGEITREREKKEGDHANDQRNGEIDRDKGERKKERKGDKALNQIIDLAKNSDR